MVVQERIVSTAAAHVTTRDEDIHIGAGTITLHMRWSYLWNSKYNGKRMANVCEISSHRCWGKPSPRAVKLTRNSIATPQAHSIPNRPTVRCMNENLELGLPVTFEHQQPSGIEEM